MPRKPYTINNSPLTKLRIALVYDDFTQYGGGERVFLAIKELFPRAQIFTSMATKEWVKRIAGSQQSGASSRKIFTSFMQKLPFKKKLQRAYFLLYPLAFESFNFSEFDLVISSSTRFAHGVITRPETKHICYMNSPGRMFWEPQEYFGDTRMGSNKNSNHSNGSRLQKVLSPALSYLRLWNYTAAQRVDHFIANSQNIAGKIKRYYRREAGVVYPFVDLERFALVNGKSSMVNGSGTINHKPYTINDYFLVVTRLNRWKRVDIAIEAIRRLNTRMGSNKDSNNSNIQPSLRSDSLSRFASNVQPSLRSDSLSRVASNVKLKIVGDGPERKRLEKFGEGKVEFLGRVSDEELVNLYQGCQALIMTQEEDFGIASLEAQASGRPVIAYGAGGALETVVEGKTGEFFNPQTAEALSLTLKKFKPKRYDPKKCRKNAERFSRAHFEKNFLKEVERAVNSE